MKKSSVIGKIVIFGKLILNSPLLIGDGASEDSENTKDIHVLKNQNNVPFIPGTSLCGVLREYMENVNPRMVKNIFGDAETVQSSIQIEDIELENYKIVFRDGVKIDSFTGTGIDGGKYDYEAIDRGAFGNIRVTMTLRKYHIDAGGDDSNYNLKKIFEAISQIILKLEDGIRLGALTAKGFGEVVVEELKAGFYDFRNKADVISWLEQKSPTPENASVDILPTADNNFINDNDFIVDADFLFNSSFIIRNYEVSKEDNAKNISAVSLKSKNDFVIPGTSLKGILRHRAEYILRKFNFNEDVLDSLMGNSSTDGKKIKSRFIVSESYISTKNTREIIHTRNKIDRFTGGTLQGTLFSTKPVWQEESKEPSLHIHFEIHNVKDDSEVGLALFLIRDLWMGKVAIGGEKSIGRGTLQGLSAKISYNGKIYELDKSGKVTNGDSAELSKFAKSVKTFADKAGVNN